MYAMQVKARSHDTTLTVKTRSHCEVVFFSNRDCDLFFLIMGCSEAGDVVTVA